MNTFAIQSSRLVIRSFRDSDFEAVLACRSDAEVCRHIGDPMTAAEVAAHIEQHKNGWAGKLGEVLRLAVELRDEGQVVGEALIRRIDAEQRRFEVGAALSPRCRRQRLGIELIASLVGHCFEALGAHRVIVFVDVENVPAVEGARSLGFRREGMLRKNTLRRGEWRDEHVMGLLEEEWPAIHTRLRDLLAAP